MFGDLTVVVSIVCRSVERPNDKQELGKKIQLAKQFDRDLLSATIATAVN
jgi:hypothetical protein